MAAEEEFVLDLTKMKIAELKRELQLRNLKVSGNKQDLIQRLQQYLEEHEGAEVEDDGSILEEEEEEQPTVSVVPEKAPEETQENVTDEPQEPVKTEEKTEEKIAENNITEVVEEPKKPMTEEDKKAARAIKYGLKDHELSDVDRLQNRSKRFGLTSADTEVDAEKLKQRAARFGTVVSGALVSKDEEERKRKRLERFGNVSQNDTPEVAEKKKKRAERFGISVA